MNFTLSITLDYQLKYYHTALIGITKNLNLSESSKHFLYYT